MDDHHSNHDCDTGPSKFIFYEIVSVSTSNSGSDNVNASDAVVKLHLLSVYNTAKLRKDANKFSGSLHCSFTALETDSGKVTKIHHRVLIHPMLLLPISVHHQVYLMLLRIITVLKLKKFLSKY